MIKPLDPTLYLVAEPALCARHGIVETVDAAVSGGVTCVEVRAPEAGDELLCELARDVIDVVAGRVPVLLCSRAHLVGEVGADGVHLGLYDLDPGRARALLGPDRYLGLSVMAVPHLDEALASGAELDYITVGTRFATDSASPHLTALPAAVTSGIVAASPWPTLAVGGITPHTLPQLGELTINGIGVSRAITTAADPRQAAQDLRVAWAERMLASAPVS